MSPLQLQIHIINTKKAVELNHLWHSRLPIITNPYGRHGICFGAEYKNIWYATAIWTDPIARLFNGKGFIELRRMAIAKNAPVNTASRMIKIMGIIIKNTFPDIYKLISYQDTEVHMGTIYKASGWTPIIANKNSNWTRLNTNRFRVENQATGPKIRWGKQIRPEPNPEIKKTKNENRQLKLFDSGPQTQTGGRK